MLPVVHSCFACFSLAAISQIASHHVRIDPQRSELWMRIVTDSTLPQPYRVCSFESRRASEMQTLLGKFQIQSTVAPSMREIPLEEHHEAIQFADRLLAGEFEIVIFMTGVGAKALLSAIEMKYDRERVLNELRQRTIIVRGPKPAAVLKEWKVPFAYRVHEPNTWRELVNMIAGVPIPVAGSSVAIQEYGKTNTELISELKKMGATVSAVPVYRWALPEDTKPMEQAIREILAGSFDAILLTSAQQIVHVLQVAEQLDIRSEFRQALKATAVISIGPTCTETVTGLGIPVMLEPLHPKMGHLVRATSDFLQSSR